VSGSQVFRGSPAPPDWLAELGGYRPCGPAELPPGFRSGWRYAAPVAHMPTYLGYLQARFERAGGRLGVGTVASLAGAAREAGARVVVNCSGAHARQLAGDVAVTPVRGQAVVAANPGLTEFLIAPSDESAELTYLFPHGEQVILGGSEAAGDWNLEPVPAVADRILRDCAAIEPRLRGTRVLGHRVGLRPARPAVRLEAEPGDGGGPLIVHNYGHGGAGVTLSWGCAREAASLAAGAPLG
jgi:D-amino-acid oxidase